uniref:t-SNARE coiled-coil homology domain-containing protein n=1 Tax=Brassica oleracea var. oleracea TaxID=109376 RepID=A0A0D3E8U4_BRAOL
MKLDGVYYTLNDSISWLTTCTEEMRQDIARIQVHRAAEATAPASIDRYLPTSIDDDLTHSNPLKSQPDPYTRAEIDQLVEDIYRTLESAEERLDRRCDDIYFPMDLTMSSLTSQIEALQREIVEIQDTSLIDQRRQYRSTNATTYRLTVADEQRSTELQPEGD